VGSIPVITGADALNEHIYKDFIKILQGEFTADNYPAYQASEGASSIVEVAKGTDTKFSYPEPVNSGRYAKVSVEIFYRNSVAKIDAEKIVLDYYVDKEGFVETTQAVYDAAVASAEEAAEAETAEETEEAEEVTQETILVPLRLNAEFYGFTVDWNEVSSNERYCTVSLDDEALVEMQLDVNAYLVADGEDILEVELEEAPILVDETVYVPSTLFTELLGVAYEDLLDFVEE
jgi:flagellar motor switch/type III secretory pathway protein FliN